MRNTEFKNILSTIIEEHDEKQTEWVQSLKEIYDISGYDGISQALTGKTLIQYPNFKLAWSGTLLDQEVCVVGAHPNWRTLLVDLEVPYQVKFKIKNVATSGISFILSLSSKRMVDYDDVTPYDLSSSYNQIVQDVGGLNNAYFYDPAGVMYLSQATAYNTFPVADSIVSYQELVPGVVTVTINGISATWTDLIYFKSHANSYRTFYMTLSTPQVNYNHDIEIIPY